MTLTRTAIVVLPLVITGALLFYGASRTGGTKAWLEATAAVTPLAGTYVVRRSIRERALDGPAPEIGNRLARRQDGIDESASSVG